MVKRNILHTKSETELIILTDGMKSNQFLLKAITSDEMCFKNKTLGLMIFNMI